MLFSLYKSFITIFNFCYSTLDPVCIICSFTLEMFYSGLLFSRGCNGVGWGSELGLPADFPLSF